MGHQTPLYEAHVAAGARMVDFGGWDMPLHYASALAEHHAVRKSCGIFDVSHMTVVDVIGPDATAFLKRLLANDIGKLRQPGQGLYSCMLNDAGGVVDDLIVYWTGDDCYRLVVNAATRVQDLAWLARVADRDDVVLRHRDDLLMVAVQGPAARELLARFLPDGTGPAALALKPFESVLKDDLFVARTGYTGEDGFEVVLPVPAGIHLWNALAGAGATRCGLGARDTLRLEAGLNLYGQDMDSGTSPLTSGLAWTVAFEPVNRQFRGRAALEQQKTTGVSEKLTGLLLEDRGIMRHGQRVLSPAGEGVITSGGFSPTMERSIALARLPVAAEGPCQVEIRGARKAARIVRPPFVRHGRIIVR
ncbi:MAG: glycine cleavage system aminomethyltransferase GcvT [Gammaproteobacteria bacterium]|nr:glycine cleavage system aminomethyltransferase GcvT [Gammaproteobacteria bacterium]